MVTNCWYLLKHIHHIQLIPAPFLKTVFSQNVSYFFPEIIVGRKRILRASTIKFSSLRKKIPPSLLPPIFPTDPKCWQVSRKYAIIIIGSVLKLAHPYPSQLAYCFSTSSSTLPISLFHLFLPFCLPLHPISYSSLSHQTLYSYYTFSLPSEVLTLQVPIQLLTRVDSVLFPSWTSSS